MGNYLIKMFSVSLVLTLFIEGALAFLWGVRGKREWKVVVLVNVATNPVAVLLYWLYRVYSARTSMLVQLVIEAAVVTVEALVYQSFAEEKKNHMKRPVLFAILANVLSFGIGAVL